MDVAAPGIGCILYRVAKRSYHSLLGGGKLMTAFFSELLDIEKTEFARKVKNPDDRKFLNLLKAYLI